MSEAYSIYTILYYRIGFGHLSGGEKRKLKYPCIPLWPRVGIDCQKRSQSGLCPKLPELRSVGDIALNPSLCKSSVDKVNIFLQYRINSTSLQYHIKMR